jgi:outer membrane translocation and assembly module TamA
MRDTLKEMLKEKGIQADVQTEEPSSFALTAQRAAGAPPPAIVFSILNPQILIDKVVIAQAPEDLSSALQDSLQGRDGHDYSSRQDWLVRSNITKELESKGYLEAEVDIAHDAPRKERNGYLVNILISVKPGSQYHIASITADGGPLLQGQDLSRFFTQKPGDIAGDNQFGPLPVQLRAYYEQRGYADVQIKAPPILDRGNGLVSYHLEVTPGPVYHLHSLTIHNLDPDREKKARELLGLNVGDVYDGMAVDLLYRKISADPALAAYGLTFSRQRTRPQPQ